MRFVKFTPSRNPEGAILGSMEFWCDKPTNIKCNIVKNKQNGNIFPSLPSKEYMNKDNEKKYENLVWFDKEQREQNNEEVIKLYKENTGNKNDELPF